MINTTSGIRSIRSNNKRIEIGLSLLGLGGRSGRALDDRLTSNYVSLNPSLR